MNQREVGTRQESRAAEYLESLGYHILVRNFRCRFGEIDLIAKQDDTYIFIEVKYRTGRTAGDPTSAVDGKKQKKISKTADYYRMLHQIPMDVPCRFDVVAETPEVMKLVRRKIEVTYLWRVVRSRHGFGYSHNLWLLGILCWS